MEPKYQEPDVLGESLESRDHIDLACKNNHTRKPLTSTGGTVETIVRLTPTWAPVYNNEEYPKMKVNAELRIVDSPVKP